MSFERISEYYVEVTEHLGRGVVKTLQPYYRLELEVTGEGLNKQVVATVVNYESATAQEYEGIARFAVDESVVSVPVSEGFAVANITSGIPDTVIVQVKQTTSVRPKLRWYLSERSNSRARWV